MPLAGFPAAGFRGGDRPAATAFLLAAVGERAMRALVPIWACGSDICLRLPLELPARPAPRGAEVRQAASRSANAPGQRMPHE